MALSVAECVALSVTLFVAPCMAQSVALPKALALSVAHFKVAVLNVSQNPSAEISRCSPLFAINVHNLMIIF